MSKGLRTLRKFFDADNRRLEAEFRTKLVDSCIKVMEKENVSPYAISKLCRYLGERSMDQQTQTLMYAFGGHLIETIAKRQVQVLEADLDDVLIDLEMTDCVDIVRVFATFVT